MKLAISILRCAVLPKSMLEGDECEVAGVVKMAALTLIGVGLVAVATAKAR